MTKLFTTLCAGPRSSSNYNQEEAREAIITVIRGMGRDDQARQDESNAHVMSAMMVGCTLLMHP